MLTSGFSYTVATTGSITFKAKLTLKSHGKTITLTKSIRDEANYGDVATPVEYSMPYATGSAATKLRSYRKKGVAVTLSVAVSGDGGFKKTLTAKTKLGKAERARRTGSQSARLADDDRLRTASRILSSSAPASSRWPRRASCSRAGRA